MTNIDLLKETIKDSGITITALASKVEITREALYNKINGINEFKASEIYKLSNALHLTDEQRNAIFFAV